MSYPDVASAVRVRNAFLQIGHKPFSFFASSGIWNLKHIIIFLNDSFFLFKNLRLEALESEDQLDFYRSFRYPTIAKIEGKMFLFPEILQQLLRKWYHYHPR